MTSVRRYIQCSYSTFSHSYIEVDVTVYTSVVTDCLDLRAAVAFPSVIRIFIVVALFFPSPETSRPLSSGPSGVKWPDLQANHSLQRSNQRSCVSNPYTFTLHSTSAQKQCILTVLYLILKRNREFRVCVRKIFPFFFSKSVRFIHWLYMCNGSHKMRLSSCLDAVTWPDLLGRR